jgi:hypothetical protein
MTPSVADPRSAHAPCPFGGGYGGRANNIDRRENDHSAEPSRFGWQSVPELPKSTIKAVAHDRMLGAPVEERVRNKGNWVGIASLLVMLQGGCDGVARPAHSAMREKASRIGTSCTVPLVW